MVAASDRLVVSVIVKRAVGGSAIRSIDSRTGHVGVVAWAVVTGTGSKSSMAGGGRSWDSSNFRVAELVVALLALPELVARAASVVVGGAGTKALLLLVMAAQEEL